ncbi:ABC transporter permease [Cupriavidus sp. AcVe19-1a]|uniref:ABC transporter permease n=1 Tax=Cupriavidus sp. AcVe19-1a TaxID=2821359 RepID=UPI001AE1413D|nr:ABC transporter permease [Cupriavidus sp. AcVe19-1a]MBP0632373.1 ABC transporter permease [Cupriavidus sp. AcVe19-1a]
MNGARTTTALWLRIWALLTLGFLLIPVAIVLPMSFSSANALTFPPPGWSLRWFQVLLSDDDWIDAFSNSALVATLTASAAVMLGSLASYGLGRGQPRWRAVAEANLMLPLILPGVIIAIALYFFYARWNLLGTITGLVLAHTLLAIPFVVMVLNTAVRSFDIRMEQVAWSLGASWSQTMRRVVLPTLAPNLAAAWIFAFVISFDEVIVSVFLAGTINTVPKKMYNDLMLEITPTITAVATVLITATALVLLLVRWLTRRKP